MWDEFGVESKRSWSADRYSAGASFVLGKFRIGLDHAYRKFDMSEEVSLQGGTEQGANPNDLSTLQLYGAKRPRNGESQTTQGVVRWNGGPLQIAVHYTRKRNQIGSEGNETIEATSPGGVLQKTESRWKSSVELANDLGQVVARWRVARAAVLNLAIATEDYGMNGSMTKTSKIVSLGIPFEVEDPSERSTNVRTTSGDVGWEFGPVGPLTVDVGVSSSGRKIEVPERSVDQSTFGFRAGADLKFKKVSLGMKIERGNTNNAYTGLTPLDQTKTVGNLLYTPDGKWDFSAKVTRATSTNDATLQDLGPLFDSDRLTVTLGGGYHSDPVEIDATCALFNLESGSVVADQTNGVPFAQILTSNVEDASASVDASLTLGRSCRAEVRSFYTNVSGSYPYTASRVEPRFVVSLGKDAGLTFGGYRYDFSDAKQSYTATGIVFGAIFYPGQAVSK
jgi:hypothetical protein